MLVVSDYVAVYVWIVTGTFAVYGGGWLVRGTDPGQARYQKYSVGLGSSGYCYGGPHDLWLGWVP